MVHSHTASDATTPRGLPRSLGRALTALMLGLGLVWGGLSGAAMAAPTDPPPAAPPATEEETDPDTAFGITGPANGAFVGANPFTITGTGTEAGATVAVTADRTTLCTATVRNTDDGPIWSCSVQGLTNGPSRVVTATETNGDQVNTASITIDLLGAPRLDGAEITTGVITGSAHPGAKITVILTGGSTTATCTTAATTTAYWSCVPATASGDRLPSGTYTVGAHQSHAQIGAPGDVSRTASRSILVDTDAPEPPVIITPAGDYRLLTLPTVFSGTGESGASVTVYLNGVPVCEATVTGSAWSCEGGSTLANAAHQVRAIQIDRAGNHSQPSDPIRVFFGPAPTTPQPTPDPTTEPSPQPTPDDSGPDDPTVTPTPGGSSGASGPRPPRFSGDAGPDALTNWGTPTDFGSGLPGIGESIDRGNWWRAPLMALAAILLVAFPVRLLANTLRGRSLLPRARFTGRNRGFIPATRSLTTEANPWVGILFPFLVTVGFLVASRGIQGEVRFLRLTVAVGAAIALLNLVGVAIASRIGRAWQGVEGRVRFRPLLLALAIASGLLSRLVGLTPPFVTGTLVGLRMPDDTPVQKRAAVNLVKVGAILGLGLLGWVGHSATRAGTGFWGNLFTEFLAALALVGIGSSVALLIPVSILPGRVLWEWRPIVWFPVALLVGTIAFALGQGGTNGSFPAATLLFIGGGIAVACLVGWAVLRFIAPQPAPAPAPAR